MDIRNSISLQDRVTPTLRSMMKAMDSTLRVMELVNKQAGAGVSSKAFKQAEKDIQRANNALIKFGNYAQMGNAKAQSATQKSIRQMNLLEVAALGAGKAMAKLGQSSGIASRVSGLKNFSLSDKFSSMQTKGTSMLNMSSMLGGTRTQAVMGSIMQSVGALGSGVVSTFNRIRATVGPTFSKIGSAAQTAFSVARNTVTSFATTAANALNGLTQRAGIAWNSIASGIYTIKSVVSALSSLTNMTDQVVSDTAKLNLHNYSGIGADQAYGLAYQAAQASRSDISTTSNLASRISMSGVYGKGQGSLESSINMAETIQKALAVGGGTPEENSRAILQLSQGLASGVLQGDELRSIREQSPYLAEMLAEGLGKVDASFAGTTAGDLKQLGADGKLTSDIVIKAFEAMEDQIDQTFEAKAPRTWAQGVTSITNTVKYFLGILQEMEGGPLQKITGLVWTISDYLQSADGMQLLASIATALGIVGDVLSFVVSTALNLISWLMDNAYILIAIFIVLGTAAMVAGIQALVAWIAAIWPILLIIAIIAILIKIILSLGFTFGDIVGAICGGIMVVISFFKNLGLSIWGIIKGVWAVLKGLWTNTGLAFENVGLGIKSFFAGILADVLGFIVDIAAALNNLPFIEFDYSGLANSATYWADQQAQADAQIEENKASMVDLGTAFTDAFNSVGAFEEGWASDAYNSGFEWGSKTVENIGAKAEAFGDMFDPATMGASLDSVGVDGGNLDSVDSIGSDVDISDEDVKLLRDMAARDYLLQLQTVTPVANVTFGDVRETADVGKIVEVIEHMVEDQMSTALVS